jgi:uncharacterized protein involved in outer membrane biogenesis
MKKNTRNIIIGLLVLIAVVIIVAGFFLGNIVKKGIEVVGPEITKVPVKLDAVNLSILTGSAKVKGLVIGNPQGYKSPDAISIGTASVGVNPLSIFSDKIVVRSVHIESPEITFEGGLGGNNLSTILDNVNATAQSGGPTSTNKTSVSQKPKSGKKIEVEDLLITGAKVRVLLTNLGDKQMTLALPEIHLTDLGQGGDGLTATDLTQRILSSIVTATIKAVANSAGNIGGLGKNAKQLGEDVGEKAGKDVNKITKGIGDLFHK